MRMGCCQLTVNDEPAAIQLDAGGVERFELHSSHPWAIGNSSQLAGVGKWLAPACCRQPRIRTSSADKSALLSGSKSRPKQHSIVTLLLVVRAQAYCSCGRMLQLAYVLLNHKYHDHKFMRYTQCRSPSWHGAGGTHAPMYFNGNAAIHILLHSAAPISR